MKRVKTLFLTLCVFIFLVPTINAAVYKLDGVYTINGVRKSEIKTLGGAYEYKLAGINSVEVNHILYGLCGTPYDNQDMDDIIGNSTLYQMNAFRIAYSFADGVSRPYNSSQIQYFLDNSDLTIIVDRNHYTGEAVNWTRVQEDCLDVLSTFTNNSRVIIEIMN